MAEAILEPELPIIDPHHHLWDLRNAPPLVSDHPFAEVIAPMKTYLLGEFLADARKAHNVVGTVFVECKAFYRTGGPEELRSLGETETISDLAAHAAAGFYGDDIRPCAGIVGRVDLTLGERAGEVIQAHIDAGCGRFCGVRNSAGYDDDRRVTGPFGGHVRDLYGREDFRRGLQQLERLGLPFDAWVFEPQLPLVVDLARAASSTTIVLDHAGTPLGLASYEGRREERFPVWRRNMAELARCENVTVKLGGLGMCFPNFPSFRAQPPAASEQLAQEWRPYIETCIELFGVRRCMFESNFPVDVGAGDYTVLWNAFKRLASGASADEKAALFFETATRTYRLKLD